MKLKHEIISKSGSIGYCRFLLAVLLILMPLVTDESFLKAILHSLIIYNHRFDSRALHNPIQHYLFQRKKMKRI